MTVIVGYVLMRNHVCNAQIVTVSAQIARDWIAIVEDWIAQLCDHKRLFFCYAKVHTVRVIQESLYYEEQSKLCQTEYYKKTPSILCTIQN